MESSAGHSSQEEGEGEAVSTEVQEGGGGLEQCVSAKFHFVDLAGSERVARTGNKGERFKGQLKEQ